MTDAAIRELLRTRVVVDSGTGCHVWTGKLSDRGYPYVSIQRKSQRAHRVSWLVYRGAIPEGHDIDHLCRNRACINPFHLEPVTHHENLMRGDTVSARHAKKDHCPKGHAYDRVVQGPGYGPRRRCTVCTREYMQQYATKRRKRA